MFDGVGGFIIGLNNADSNYYKTLYSNQFEPTRKSQDALEVGKYRFPDMEHIGIDVAKIPDEKFIEMKNNGVNMIVGGFPCQDYSVAHKKHQEMGCIVYENPAMGIYFIADPDNYWLEIIPKH